MPSLLISNEQSEYKPIPTATMDNCNVFEQLLEIEELGKESNGPPISYEKLESMLSNYDIPMNKLCSPEAKTLSYSNQWKKEWKRMLGVITLSYIRYFSRGCYNNCGRGVDDVMSSYHQLRKVRTTY